MKTPTTYLRSLFPLGWTLALALSTTVTSVQSAQPRPGEPMTMKSGERMFMMFKLKNATQAQQLKPGDSIAMACAKCKSVVVQNVTTERAHVKIVTVGEKHLCPGCKSTITVVGVGKKAKDEVKHVCGECGSNSAFCCATTPDTSPTEGMPEPAR